MAAPTYSYNLQNTRRDLTDVLNTLIAKSPRFISLFPNRGAAKHTKHEWLEDLIEPRTITALSASGLALTCSAADTAAVKPGTVLKLQGSAAILQVATAITTTVTCTVLAANGTGVGSGDDLVAGVYDIISTPQGEATSNGSGEESYRILDTAYNYTQIIRKEIYLSGSSLAVPTYGSIDNNIQAQTAFMLQNLAYDLGGMCIWGVRTQRTSSVKGQAGGLYSLAAAGLSVNAVSTPHLSSTLVNDAAEEIMGKGGNPSVVLCSINQARNMSAEYASKLHVVLDDQKSGQFVGRVTNDVTGQLMTIMADPAYRIDSEAWVCDPSGFGMAYLRPFVDRDTTSDGYDGIVRTLLGEFTFEFKNVESRCCRIKGLSGGVNGSVTPSGSPTPSATGT